MVSGGRMADAKPCHAQALPGTRRPIRLIVGKSRILVLGLIPCLLAEQLAALPGLPAAPAVLRPSPSIFPQQALMAQMVAGFKRRPVTPGIFQQAAEQGTLHAPGSG